MESRRVEMISSVVAVCLYLVVLACVELGDAATAVDVYRLIQYDLGGAPFGSRLATLNHHASSSLAAPYSSDHLSRTVVILPIRDLDDLSSLQDCVDRKQPLGGLLFLLPRDFDPDSEITHNPQLQLQQQLQLLSSYKDKLLHLERLLVHATIPYPVYFAFEDDHISDVLADIRRNDASGQPATATTGGYKLVVTTAEPRKILSPTITNIQGWLPGLKLDGDASQIPTIAIVASYDTFGAAPALSVGSDSNGSGVVALLEIARLFSLLYSNPKTRGRYNLLFALTSGGPYNYNGTQKWLRSLDQRLRESIDYAICLNSIGSWDNELWLHVSKPPENAYIKQILNDFSDIAGELRVKVGLKHKKINISNSRVAWEHEQFSRLRVTAATLSELSSAPEFLENFGGLSDSRHFVSETAVHRGVKLVAESLAGLHSSELVKMLNFGEVAIVGINIDKNANRHIYGHEGKNIQIFAENSSFAVNPSYINSWLRFLSRTPRVAPFLLKTDPLISAFRKELEEHTAELNVQQENFDGIFTFYDSTKAILNIYQVASVTFDLLLLLVLGSYLIVLFSFLVITTRGLDDLISLFRRPPSRKVKTA